MRIVDRKQFLALPPGTLYCKYKPPVFGHLRIKGETISLGDPHSDFWSAMLKMPSAWKPGESFALDLDTQTRDAALDDDQLFAVYEPDDVNALISRLVFTARDATPTTDWDRPDWDAAMKCHDWRNHVGDTVRSLWLSFTPAQKQALAIDAQARADAEEWD